MTDLVTLFSLKLGDAARLALPTRNQSNVMPADKALSLSSGINHMQTLALPAWIRFDNLHTPLPHKFVRGSLSLSPFEPHGIFYSWPKSLSIVPHSPKDQQNEAL